MMTQVLNPFDDTYLSNLRHIFMNGYDHVDRTGKGRRTIPGGICMRFDLTLGFPLLTTRNIPTKNIFYETPWFIKGVPNNKILNEKNVNIWNMWSVKEEDIEEMYLKNTDKDLPEEYKTMFSQSCQEQYEKAYGNPLIGSIGPMYGNMWRSAPISINKEPLTYVKEYTDYPSDLRTYIENTYPEDPSKWNEIAGDLYNSKCDQLNNLLLNLKQRPYSSRHIVTAWIPEFVPDETLSPQENVIQGRGALAACHCMFQCFVSPPKEDGGKKRLTLQVYIRSMDFPIGTPTNIAQYALLTHLIARHVDMEPIELIVMGGDAHIYLNQLEYIPEHLSRVPTEIPHLKFNTEEIDIFKIEGEHFEVIGYNPVQPQIKYPLAK
jgi:thymidylate synthase